MTGKPKLWVTRRLSDATLERAARDYDAVINFDDGLSSDDDLVAMSAQVDAIIPVTQNGSQPKLQRSSIRA